MNEEQLLNIAAHINGTFDFETLQDNFDLLENSQLLNSTRQRPRLKTNEMLSSLGHPAREIAAQNGEALEMY